MIFLIITGFLFSLGQLGRISILHQEINFYLFEIPYFIWIAYLILKTRPTISRIIWVLIAVLVGTYLIGIQRVSFPQNGVALLYLMRLSAYLIAFEVIVEHLNKIKNALPLVRLVSFLIIIIGVVQYFLYSNLRNLQYLGWDPHQSRVFGLFFEPSVAGAVYGLLAVFFILTSGRIMKQLPSIIHILALTLLGLFTYSRGFLVAFFVAISAYGLFVLKKTKLVLGLFSLIILFMVFAPKPFGEGVNLLRTSTIQSRIVDYQQGLKVWQSSPFFGIGYNRIRYEKPALGEELWGKSHAGASFHSTFLILLATTGAIGFGMFCYWLWRVTRYGSFALVSTIFLGAYSLFDNILIHPFILFLWPVLIGITSRKKQ